MTQGAYICEAREAGAKPLTRDDVCYGLETSPPVSRRAPVELLEQVEGGLLPVSDSTLTAFASALPHFELEHLAELVDAHPAERPSALRLTRATLPRPL